MSEEGGVEEAKVVLNLLETARFLERKLLEDLQGVGDDVEKITVRKDDVLAMLHLLNGFSDATKTLLLENRMLNIKLAEKNKRSSLARA